MLQFAATALVAFALAMIVDLPVAGTTQISTDPYIIQLCGECTPLMNNTVKTDRDWRVLLETLPHGLAACKPGEEFHCEIFGDDLSADAEAEITKSANAQIGPEASNSLILREDRERYQDNGSCSYLESKLRDADRVREQCELVEPGSGDSEFVSLITLTTVSVISFAVLAGFWLLHRSFRNRQLRKMIRREKTSSKLEIGKGRRRSVGPIRG